MDIALYKTALRISHGKLDAEIEANIEACKADLRRVGIGKTDEEDPILHKVIELYLKWQYNFMSDGERFKKAYEELRNGLSLCGDYNDRQKEPDTE